MLYSALSCPTPDQDKLVARPSSVIVHTLGCNSFPNHLHKALFQSPSLMFIKFEPSNPTASGLGNKASVSLKQIHEKQKWTLPRVLKAFFCQMHRRNFCQCENHLLWLEHSAVCVPCADFISDPSQ